MNILFAQFSYSLTERELRATADELAPGFAHIPGCFEKTWIIDAATNTAGGIYKFRDRGSVDAYLASELWKGVESAPPFSNVTTRVFDVLEQPTAVTHGLPVATAAH